MPMYCKANDERNGREGVGQGANYKVVFFSFLSLRNFLIRQAGEQTFASFLTGLRFLHSGHLMTLLIAHCNWLLVQLKVYLLDWFRNA